MTSLDIHIIDMDIAAPYQIESIAHWMYSQISEFHALNICCKHGEPPSTPESKTAQFDVLAALQPPHHDCLGCRCCQLSSAINFSSTTHCHICHAITIEQGLFTMAMPVVLESRVLTQFWGSWSCVHRWGCLDLCSFV